MSTPIDILGGFYTDESLPWSCQDVVNYIPVAAEVPGARTQIKLVDAPGLKPRAWIGNYATGPEPTGAIRGMHDVEGKLFVVCGTTLYQFTNDGVAIPLGTIPGTGRVSMAHNQITGGNQLIVVNGSAGYVWNTVDGTFQRVVDSSYPGASIVEFIDGYLMQLEPFGRFLLHSDLANALSYNALDRFDAETAPDMTVGLAILHQEVWALGERTIDVFENVGAAQGTFRNKGVSISRGCVARWSTAVIDNGLAWLGDNGTVYHARGYDPVRISTRAIEVALSSHPLANLRNAFAFVWEDRGHAVYYLTVPGGQTFGYDFSTGLWHRRASWHPQRELSGRWRLNELIRHNGKWVGGDYKAGKLYDLDWAYMMEGEDSPLARERVTPVAHNNADRFIVNEVELLYDSGGPETEPVEFPTQPKGPEISGSAPDGGLGLAYDGFQYTITAGDAAIVSVEVVSGSLPPGLSMDNSGEIDTGTPTALGGFTFTIRVTDAAGLWSELTDTVHVFPVSFATKVGMNGVLLVSKNGESWGGSIDSGLGGNASLLKAAGGNLYVFGSSGGRVSTDSGQTFHDVVFDGSFDKTTPTGIGYANGVWIMSLSGGRHIGRSTDGITFVPVEINSSPRDWSAAAGSGSTFIIGSSQGMLWRSEDGGLTWSGQIVLGASTAGVGEVHWNDERAHFVIGVGWANNPYRVLFSGTGAPGSWTTTFPGVSSIGSKRMLSLGGSTLLVDGVETYITSDDGDTWVKGQSLSAGQASPTQFNNITHNGLRIIAGVTGGIDISDNGTEWANTYTDASISTYIVASLGEQAGE